jgi:hypothetical protein
MKKSERSLAAEGVRIDKQHYRSFSPFNLFKSVVRVIFSGGSVMSPHRVYGRKK